jgi:hypothetical protein
MKKMFVFALAALSLAGQMNLAHAAGAGRDPRPVEARAREAERARRDAGKEGAAGAHSAEAVELGRQIDGLRIGRLSAEDNRALKALVGSDEGVRTAVREIVATQNDAAMREFNEARLSALAKVKGISESQDISTVVDPVARAARAFRMMATTAGTKAAAWTGGEGGARDSFRKILQAAVESNKAPGEALIEAVKLHLRAQTGKEPTQAEIEKFIKSITEYCK